MNDDCFMLVGVGECYQNSLDVLPLFVFVFGVLSIIGGYS